MPDYPVSRLLDPRVVFDANDGFYKDTQAPRSEFYETNYLALNPALHREDVEDKARVIVAALECLNLERVGIILDVGCGSCDVLCRMLDVIAQRTRRSRLGIGVDISGTILASATKDPRIIRLRASADNLPIPPGSISLALCVDIIEHVENPQDVLREISRVAEQAILKVPLELSLYTRLRGGRQRLVRLARKYGHRRHFNRKALLRLVEAQFEVKRAMYVPIPRRNIILHFCQTLLLNLRLNRLFAAIFGGFAILTVSSKLPK